MFDTASSSIYCTVCVCGSMHRIISTNLLLPTFPSVLVSVCAHPSFLSTHFAAQICRDLWYYKTQYTKHGKPIIFGFCILFTTSTAFNNNKKKYHHNQYLKFIFIFKFNGICVMSCSESSTHDIEC